MGAPGIATCESAELAVKSNLQFPCISDRRAVIHQRPVTTQPEYHLVLMRIVIARRVVLTSKKDRGPWGSHERNVGSGRLAAYTFGTYTASGLRLHS